MKGPSSDLVRQRLRNEWTNQPPSVRQLVEILVPYCVFEWGAGDMMVRVKPLSEASREKIGIRLLGMQEKAQQEACRILHHHPLFKPMGTLVQQAKEMPDSAACHLSVLDQDGLRSKYLRGKTKDLRLSMDGLGFCKWWVQHCDIRLIPTGDGWSMQALFDPAVLEEAGVMTELGTLLPRVKEYDLPYIEILFGEQGSYIVNTFRELRGRIGGKAPKNAPLVANLKMILGMDLKKHDVNMISHLGEIERMICAPGSRCRDIARQFMSEFGTDFPTSAYDDENAFVEIRKYHKEFPDEMSPMIAKAAAGLQKAAAAMLGELSAFPWLPDGRGELKEMEAAETMLMYLQRAAYMLQMMYMEEEDKKEGGTGPSGTALGSDILIVSSVCQSLMLQFLQQRFPVIFSLNADAGAASPEMCASFFRDLSAKMEHMIHRGKAAGDGLEASMNIWLHDWKEAFENFFAMVLSEKSSSQANGMHARPDRLQIPVPIDARLTSIHENAGDGTAAAISSTEALCGLGPVAKRTVWNGSSSATAWIWAYGQRPCHDKKVLLPAVSFLPADNAGVVALDRIASAIEDDLNDWSEICRNMGVSPQLAALHEEGFTPHILRIGLPRHNGTGVRYDRRLICAARERELLGNTNKMVEANGDSAVRLAALKDRGIALPPNPLMLAPAHEHANTNGKAASVPAGASKMPTEDPMSIRLHRVKELVDALGRKKMFEWDDAVTILEWAGVTFGPHGGKHFKWESSCASSPRPWRTSESKPKDDGEMLVQTLEDILYELGDLDALEQHLQVA